MEIEVSIGGPGDTDSTIVLVDVYRSSTTIITALDNGAKYILPFNSAEEARKARKEWDEKEDVVLAGENLGMKLEGFDLNISPGEMSEENIRDKIIMYKSDNLTRILTECKDAEEVMIGGIINSRATAEYLNKMERDKVEIVACGTHNKARIREILGISCDIHDEVTMEDVIGAGAILQYLSDENLSDMALISLLAYENSDWREKISRSCILMALRNLGIDEDREYYFTEDVSDTVPVFEEDRILAAMD